MYSEEFKNKVVLITGGTSGLGKATAQAFAKAGARVVVAGRSSEKGKAVARELQQIQAEALFVATDVADAASVERLFEQIRSEFGRLDYAFNNAANTERGTFQAIHAFSEEDYDAAMNVNLKSVWHCMKQELMLMQEVGGGAIVNTSSVNGLGGVAHNALYAAAKAGVQALTKSAAQEYAGANIRVNVLVAGAFDTPMLRGVFSTVSPQEPQKVQEAFEGQIPLRRIGRPEEAAEAVLWLCSSRSSYMTGNSFILDGGLTSSFR